MGAGLGGRRGRFDYLILWSDYEHFDRLKARSALGPG